jgi:PadR family transcriptional regulator, regulatory protein PadR
MGEHVGRDSGQNTVLKGTLDVLVLKALSRASMHGFEVTEWLEQQASGSLGLDDSAVYQALYRMEKRGLVTAEWGVSEKNRRARYYELTTAGRTHLKRETERVLRYADLVRGILTMGPGSAQEAG